MGLRRAGTVEERSDRFKAGLNESRRLDPTLSMNASIRNGLLATIIWLVFFCIILPSNANRRSGQSSCLRLDPTISTNYQFIFIKGYSRPRFKVPWISRSTPVDYLTVRYTPDLRDQDGILFIDPNTLAYEAHKDLAKSPTNMSGHLDSPAPILDWMRTQPVYWPEHVEDAQAIYDAVIALSHRDLEHFTLPEGTKLSHFKIGCSLLSDKHRPSFDDFPPLVLIWWAAYAAQVKKRQPASAPEPRVHIPM